MNVLLVAEVNIVLSSEAIDLFANHNRRRLLNKTLSATTVANYTRDCRDFLTLLTTLETDLPVANITVEQFSEVFEAYSTLPDARRKDTKQAQRVPRSDRTRNRFYYSVSALFGYLVDTGVLPTNPVKRADGKVRLSALELDPKRKDIGAANLGRLLDAPLTARDEFIVRVLSSAGVRVGELCACDTDDLTYDPDLQCWWLRLLHTKNGKPRRVALSEITVAFYKNYRRTEIVPPAARPNGMPLADAERAMLRTSRGRRVTPRDLQNLLSRLGPVTGVHTTPHGLRHTAATTRIREGFDIHVVRDLLGHSSTATTSQYLDANNADLAEMARTSSVDDLGKSGRSA